ncbi:MAG: reverse transcriptase/maturase family protein [Gammaproteobacteria bacterium]|nr:reverse transcriptase/maturase family protein [Gammaproteobacteria bacterium]
MRRIGGVWGQVVAMDNLHTAYGKARQGKRRRPDVAQFSLDLESNLLTLQRELVAGAYAPGPYRQFTVYERKPRLISVAPFRDRVVHHAVMNVLEPLLDQRFIPDTYACRKDKGVHRAVDRYQQFARQNAYVLKLDIARYFPSIDREILKQQLARRLKDRFVLDLLYRIIDNGPDTDEPVRFFPGDDLVSLSERQRGLPIGNLTSQFFANLYLDGFDHWLKETVRVKGYLRYVDDLYLLGNDKQALWDLRDAIIGKLEALRLVLRADKTQIYRTTERVDVLGYRVSRYRRWLRNDNGVRFRRRLKRMSRLYRAGEMDWPAINASVQSWTGHARHAQTEGLRTAIFSEVSFNKGAGRGAAGA